MIRYSVLGSGSCGNSYVFSCGDRSVLIDAGYSWRQICLRMHDGGFSEESVMALFLTHLHPDHAHAAGIFARKTAKPVYVSRKCRDHAVTEYLALNIPESSFRLAIRRGEVEVIRVTGHGGIRIRRSALEKWLAMKERESRALVLAG